jgi:putative addiction module component (TIGR02574 family)
MTQRLKELTEQALHLPPDDRVTLAESLLLTVDDAHDQRVNEAVIQELERRAEDLRSGKVEGIPAEEVFAKLRERLKRRS